HEHAPRRAVAAIRRDLVRPIVVADTNGLPGALDLGAQIAGEPAEPLAPTVRCVVRHPYGTIAGGETWTRPIMFASPPNQICRVVRSKVMCRIVFASRDGMVIVSVNFF